MDGTWRSITWMARRRGRPSWQAADLSAFFFFARKTQLGKPAAFRRSRVGRAVVAALLALRFELVAQFLEFGPLSGDPRALDRDFQLCRPQLGFHFLLKLGDFSPVLRDHAVRVDQLVD